mgnify:CR=1 FL=1
MPFDGGSKDFWPQVTAWLGPALMGLLGGAVALLNRLRLGQAVTALDVAIVVLLAAPSGFLSLSAIEIVARAMGWQDLTPYHALAGAFTVAAIGPLILADIAKNWLSRQAGDPPKPPSAGA